MTYQIDKLEKLVALLEKQTPQEEYNPTGLHNLGTFRASAATQHKASTYYEPSIVIVVGQP